MSSENKNLITKGSKTIKDIREQQFDSYLLNLKWKLNMKLKSFLRRFQ
jgi:hypothetical protein